VTGYFSTTEKPNDHQTKQQYRKAVSEGALMVFVRDEVNEVLRSYIFPKAD